MAWTLQSSALPAGGDIPRDYTCDGADRSPPLSWTDPPGGTQSLALIVHDPDAPGGDFTHWVLFNLPARLRELPPGLPPDPELADGSRQGRNGFGRAGYGGPCAPAGPAHRYVFELSALDAPLPLGGGATRPQVEAAMRGHSLGRAQLTGTYRRQSR
jgi:Raf kinase inhibitor-like YbhB/YbcL family protein